MDYFVLFQVVCCKLCLVEIPVNKPFQPFNLQSNWLIKRTVARSVIDPEENASSSTKPRLLPFFWSCVFQIFCWIILSLELKNTSRIPGWCLSKGTYLIRRCCQSILEHTDTPPCWCRRHRLLHSYTGLLHIHLCLKTYV